MPEYMWGPAVLGAIAILVVVVLKLIAAAAKWNVLAADFPANASASVLAKFSDGIKHVGAVRFKRSGVGSVAITDRGILVSIANPFMSNLMIPFASIRTIRSYTLFGRTTLSLNVDHAVPLTLELPVDAFPHLKGKVSDNRFQQGERVDSIGDLLDIVMNRPQQPSAGDVATRATPEK